VRNKILEEKEQKTIAVLEAAGIFEEAAIVDDREEAERLYGEAKDILNKARATTIARELVRDLPIVAQLNDAKARVELIMATHSARKSEISHMRQSRKKDSAYEEAQALFEGEIARIDADLSRIGSKYRAERLLNLAVEAAVELDSVRLPTMVGACARLTRRPTAASARRGIVFWPCERRRLTGKQPN